MTNASSPPHTRVLSLPELLTPIGSYLDPPSLLSCVQVCWDWNELLIPILWGTIDDRFYSWPAILKQIIEFDGTIDKPLDKDKGKDEDWLRGIYAKYGHHIRHLRADWNITLTMASSVGTCTNLRTLSRCTADKWSGGDRSRSRVITLPFPGLDMEALLAPSVLPTLTSWRHSIASEQAYVAWILTQRCWLLVLQNPLLESVDLANCFRFSIFSFPENLVITTLTSLSNLTTLVNDTKHIPLQDLFLQLPLLRHYTCHICPPVAYSDIIPGVPNAGIITGVDLHTTFPQLQTLSLGYRQEGTLLCFSVLQFLRYLPNLQRLTIPWLMPLRDDVEDAGALIGHTASRLQELEVHRIHLSSRERQRFPLAHHLLPWLPSLTKLSMNMKLEYATAHALAKCCPQLESFRYMPKLNTDDIPEDINATITLLMSLPNFRVLDTPFQTIELETWLEVPLVCRGLQVLRCQVVELDRFTASQERKYEDWIASRQPQSTHDPEDDMKLDEETIAMLALRLENDRRWREIVELERCQERHHRFYDLIGGLTELKVLELGVDKRVGNDYILGRWDRPDTYSIDGRLYYKNLGPIRDTPRLDLESGLDRLKTLTKLEVFGFEGVDHRIGKEELAWMAESWPRLQAMYGLGVPTNETLMLNCPKTDDLPAYMQMLRPSVQHLSHCD